MGDTGSPSEFPGCCVLEEGLDSPHPALVPQRLPTLSPLGTSVRWPACLLAALSPHPRPSTRREKPHIRGREGFIVRTVQRSSFAGLAWGQSPPGQGGKGRQSAGEEATSRERPDPTHLLSPAAGAESVENIQSDRFLGLGAHTSLGPRRGRQRGRVWGRGRLTPSWKNLLKEEAESPQEEMEGIESFHR